MSYSRFWRERRATIRNSRAENHRQHQTTCMPLFRRVLPLAMVFAGLLLNAETRKSGLKGSPPRTSHLHIQSAILLTGSGASVQLSELEVELPPKEYKGTQPTIIHSGAVFITSEQLTRLIADKLAGGKIKDLKIETESGQKAKISGTMHKAGIPVPVSIEGPVSVTREGLLRMEIKSEKAAAIPMKAFAEMVGMSPHETVTTKPGSPVRMEKDALLVNPNGLLGTA
jgi:hypothetical protein